MRLSWVPYARLPQEPPVSRLLIRNVLRTVLLVVLSAANIWLATSSLGS